MSIIAATLLTDRKPVFPVSLEYLTQEPLIDKIYLNVQTKNWEIHSKAVERLGSVQNSKPFDIDYWDVNSSWAQVPTFDQDPARFMPIARGRNMALDWALIQTQLDQSVSHLLFVDSDVRPHMGGLQHLLDLGKPITGGFVPGRGAHSHVHYVFGNARQEGYVIQCEHGTSGYLLIERSLFEVMRFRSGPSIDNRETWVCDDPAFAGDARHAGLADAWYIDTRASADHVDDPNNPLTLAGAINNYNNP